MKTTLLALAMLIASAPAVSALSTQSSKKFKVYPGTGIDWKGDWEAALLEAKVRNVPIMFCIHKDN